MAKEGKIDPIIGRDQETQTGHTNPVAEEPKITPVLIGEPGVGKTAVVEGLAPRELPTATCLKR